jgi:NAD+ synthase
MSIYELLKINTQKTADKISKFIYDQMKNSGLKRGIVSISGGIDSAVALALTVRALGPKNVKAITLPERDITPQSDITDVMQLTRSLDVTCDTIEITPILHVMRECLPSYDSSDKISVGNIKSRTRMVIAYYYANSLQGMVIGSSNKTELMTGYFTKYGDGGVDLMPIADLYKNQVRQLAEYLEMPSRIVDKIPSAGLWPGQSDEEELGISYDLLDQILFCLEKNFDEKEISDKLRISRSIVTDIKNRVKNNEHKRRSPLFLRLTFDN